MKYEGILVYSIVWFVFCLPVTAWAFERRKSDVPNWRRWAIFMALVTSMANTPLLIPGLLRNILTVRLDAFIFIFDSFLGQPSFVLGRFLATHSRWSFIAGEAYSRMAVVQGAVLLWCLLRESIEEVWTLVRAMMIAPLLGLLFYAAFPVSGPRYAFDGFPFSVPIVYPHLMYFNAIPNGIPSLHMTFALLDWWFLRKSWFGRIAGGIFAALTVIATLGMGEHYLFDLLLAIPFTMLVVYLSNSPRVVDNLLQDAGPSFGAQGAEQLLGPPEGGHSSGDEPGCSSSGPSPALQMAHQQSLEHTDL